MCCFFSSILPHLFYCRKNWVFLAGEMCKYQPIYCVLSHFLSPIPSLSNQTGQVCVTCQLYCACMVWFFLALYRHTLDRQNSLTAQTGFYINLEEERAKTEIQCKSFLCYIAREWAYCMQIKLSGSRDQWCPGFAVNSHYCMSCLPPNLLKWSQKSRINILGLVLGSVVSYFPLCLYPGWGSWQIFTQLY